MTKKGPIETIREACEQWRKGLWSAATREEIEKACDAMDEERVTLNQLTAFVVLLTDANRLTIADALNLQGGNLNGGSVDTGERLTAICREWAEHKRNRTKPYVFDFDDADLAAVEKAIAKRATLDAMPKSLSCERGALLAEICRGWLEHVEHDETKSEQIRADAAEALAEHDERRTERIDNGDGTVTFPSVPVTVPAEIVADGADVLGVGVPEPGERYVVVDGTKSRTCTDEKWLSTELRIILSAPPAPQFREGGYYRTRGGEVKGPIRRVETSESEYVLIDDHTGAKYTERGCRIGISSTDDDLRPGEVTVWAKPPVSLRADKYKWNGKYLARASDGQIVVGVRVVCNPFADWTPPPREGIYTVPGGGKPATWEGDAP